MKKRILSALTSLSLVLALLPTTMRAADEDLSQPPQQNELEFAEESTIYVDAQADEEEDTDGDAVYQTLQAALAAVQDGETIVLLSDVTVDGSEAPTNTALVLRKNNVTLDGRGNQIQAGSFPVSDSTSKQHILGVEGVSGVTIKDLTISGVNTQGNMSRHALHLYCSTDVKLEDVTLKNTAGYGLLVNASDVTVTGHLTLENNGPLDCINVGWGVSAEADSCSFNASEATLIGVDLVYTDAKDITNADSSSGIDKFHYDMPANYLEAVRHSSTGIAYIPAAAYTGGTYYKTLAEAVTAAESGSEITLLKDVAEHITIDSDDEITLDLNGHILQNTAGEEQRGTPSHTITNSGTLTIQDGVGTGGVISIAGDKSAVFNDTTGTCTIEGGSLRHNVQLATADASSDSQCLIFNQGNLIIEGGTFTSDHIAVKNDEEATLEIGGEAVLTGTQSLQNWGEATVTGGELNGLVSCFTKDESQATLDIQGGTITGDVNSINYGGTATNAPQIEISGSTVVDGSLNTLSGTNADDGEPATQEQATIIVSGGSFTESVPSDYLAEGLNYESNGEDGYTYHTSFENAMDASGNTGSVTVTKPEEVADETVTLPQPEERPGYIFLGWQLQDGSIHSAGSQIEASKVVGLTALWEAEDDSSDEGSGGGSSGGDHESGYTVTIAATQNGSITAIPKRADKGDTVTITVKPNQGYQLHKLTVLDSNDEELQVKSQGDGKYTFTMPAGRVTVKGTFRSIHTGGDFSFTDVDSQDYYYDAVAWALENGVTTGVTDTIFAPGNPCTRAQTVTFLWRAAGKPQASNQTNPFTDVKKSDYYYEAVLWAVEKGITQGTTATTFSPNATCTRAQVVTFLWRYSGEHTGKDIHFADVSEDAYYYRAVAWAVESGITQGTTATTFSPDAICTRGQIVTFLYRDLGKV